ncbi:hypothetical protein ACIBL3_11290 [Kribbella sp. NPDC050124]|uniref:hypothetical protein n=1 Tax=Kribbella sp. NPDC050124 TaxID=3364114 RepID=UPI0037B832E1
MRNYWALLPAIAVMIGLILLYAIPTLINPQWTSSILGLFRQFPEDPQHAQNSAQNQQRPAGVLGPQQVKSRRMLAGFLVVAALALLGFNIQLNRESNACYQAATAWGAIDGDSAEDPCINMIYGTFFGDGTGSKIQDNSQAVPSYQVVHKKKPTYLRWIQNAPKYDEADLLIGTVMECASDLRITEEEDKVVVLIDANQPCPDTDNVSLTSYKLKKPLGDRKVVTVDDKPMEQISPDVDSWPTVVKKLVTGG